MKLVVYKNKNLISIEFTRFVIKHIKLKILTSINYNKLTYINEYLSKEIDYFNMKALVNELVNNIVFDNFMDRYEIHFSNTKKIGKLSIEDIAKIISAGNGRIGYTVGSALDIFGGPLPYAEIVKLNSNS